MTHPEIPLNKHGVPFTKRSSFFSAFYISLRSILNMPNMMKLKLPLLLSAGLFAGALGAHAQLFIDNATFFIQTGGTVTVQGDVTSNVNIQGPGKVLLKGSTNQNVNMNGFTIPNLEMDNTAGATLTGNARIGTSMLFTNGKIIQGNFNMRLADVATVTGAGAGKFFETTGTGQLVKEVSSNLTNYVMPLGIGSTYYPASITTAGTYASATVGVQGKNGSDPNKHPRSTDYLNLHWPITQSGITGTLNATGNYNANFTGTETDMRGIFWNGTNWTLAGAAINYATDEASAPIVGNGDLYAMNRFLLTRPRVFLQGTYNSGTGLMNENLRTPTNVIPLSDPYRSSPYNTYFSHVNNASIEVANASVFTNQPLAADNIVDWVFLELRDNSGVNPGATRIQTRSALVQRDGDIVDIDGVSPIYFKNLDAAANYTLAVRHRNHLGLSTDPVANLLTLNESSATAVNFTTYTDAQLFGTTAAYTTSGGINLLWAGNVSGNGFVRYQGNNGPGATNVSDRQSLLTDLGNNELAILSGYNRGDLNMNGFTRYQGNNGPGVFNQSDRQFLLGTVLGSNELTIRTQSLPQ
jgi:hypothetical protein